VVLTGETVDRDTGDIGTEEFVDSGVVMIMVQGRCLKKGHKDKTEEKKLTFSRYSPGLNPINAVGVL
jgi:hypothetical protein